MRSYLEAVVDGLVTGLCLALLVVAWGWLGGAEATTTGSRLFLAGLAVIGLAILVRFGDSADPPGMLGLLRRQGRTDTSSDALEQTRMGAFRWIDRLVPLDSPWLTAGFTLVAVAFLPPFLGL